MSDEIRDIRKPGWFWAQNELIDRDGAELGVYGIAVYCALAKMAGTKGEADPSVPKLAKLLSCSQNSVRKALNKLQELGWITIEKREKKDENGKLLNQYTNLYTLLDNGGNKSQNPPSRDEVGGASDEPAPPSRDEGKKESVSEKESQPEADASGPAPTVFELRSRAMDALKESTNVTSVVVGFAVDVFGEDVKDYGRAGKEIRRVKDKLGISYRAAAEEIIGCLAAAGEMEPRPANVWDYTHGIVRTRTKDAKPAPREYVPKHVDVYVPPADVANPVRRKETEA